MCACFHPHCDERNQWIRHVNMKCICFLSVHALAIKDLTLKKDLTFCCFDPYIFIIIH